ncbi:MAG: S8 family serine peptidase [Proteobacteria bacterium]|jgi:subtilisin family serine protease|nr:S8 family serine peptidase [Pseudomonadota bacterium]
MRHLLAAAVIVLSVQTYAGNVIRFHNGSVDPKQAQRLFSMTDLKASKDFVIQFKDTIQESDRALLQNAGLRVFRYIPDNALVVRGTLSQLSQVSQSTRVNGFVPFRAQYKMSENLPALSSFSQGFGLTVVVTTLSEQDLANVQNAIESLNPRNVVKDSAGRVLVATIEMSSIPQVANLAGVEFVQKAEAMTPFHMTFGDDTATLADSMGAGDYSDLTGTGETGTKIMNFESAWAMGYTGRGEVVAMADTGLDSGDVLTVSSDFKGSITKGYSFGVGAKSWEDPMGHGTHVAGSVMSRGTASGGLLKGGAFEAGMIPQGMWSPIVENLTVPPRLNRLFDAALADGARLHTNSWGNPNALGTYDAMAAQVDDFMWKNPDFLVIFAAGNSGIDKDKDGRIDPGSVSSPGTSKNSLTVGASENETKVGGIQRPIKDLRPAKEAWPAEPIYSSMISDNGMGIAMFSSRGPTKDGRTKPELVAPGTNILSNRSQVDGASELWGAYNADYAWSGGTSMATPLTAGAAAVVRQILSEKFATTTPSAALVKAYMLHTAFDLYPGQYGEGTATQELLTRRPNSDEGYGRVDMKMASELSDTTTALVDYRNGVKTGEVFERTVSVEKGQKVLVNLVWTDAPGSPTAAKALVNDLDLIVELNGSVLTGKDAINNNEIFEGTAAAAGTLKITVKGANVPMGNAGNQPFALIYSVLE